MAHASPLDLIKRGTTEIISETDLAQKLKSGRPLIIKAGFDPTAPDLHLGHTVLLRKLRHFQELGHKVIFLIGDATGLVGDPSGQSQTRKVLTWDDVRQYASTYQAQVKKVLLTDRAVYEVRYNSEWFLGRSPQMRQSGLELFDFSKFVSLAAHATVARLIERDDFSKRLKAGKPVSFLELFYPLMQGYDSVKIAEQHGYCDVELGGTDQKFNLLMGRELLKAYGHSPQVVLTMPLLEGTDGVAKMSKSLGNHIGINEPPGDMFGKLMSIPDPLITKYFTLLTDVEAKRIAEVEAQLKARSINPRDAKLELAVTIVAMYHGQDSAAQAKDQFIKVFSQRETPSEMPIASVRPDAEGKIQLIDVMLSAGVVKTKNEARRLIQQKAVKLNGQPVETSSIASASCSGVLQVGSRRFLKLVVSS